MSSSIFSRLIASIFGNLLKSALSFFTGILLARGLGPSEYGEFAFLLSSFMMLTQLLDMGSSNAFYTFISQKLRSQRFYLYYILWVTSQFIFSVLLLSMLTPESWIQDLWQGESRERVVFAFIAVFFQQQIWQMISQIGESQRLTHRIQLINVLNGCIHFSVIGILYWWNILSIKLVFSVIIVEYIGIVVVAYFMLRLQYTKETKSFWQIFTDYKIYCLPLIPYAWISFADGFASTWLLQHYAGSIQQAYYAVAMQFSAISLLATRSVLSILWKEIAEANNQNNYKHVLNLFNNATKALFFIAGLITGFLIPWVREIIHFTLGEAYIAGVTAMSLMFFYPINQARGQVNGATFLALELTRPYVVIGIFGMSTSIVVAYFVLAPTNADIPGLGLGSTGMALKMIGLQFISVNVSIWWLTQHLKGHFDWLYQFTGIGVFLFFGYIAYSGANGPVGETLPIVIRVMLAAGIYMAATMMVLYRVPVLFGIERVQLDRYIKKLSDFTMRGLNRIEL